VYVPLVYLTSFRGVRNLLSPEIDFDQERVPGPKSLRVLVAKNISAPYHMTNVIIELRCREGRAESRAEGDAMGSFRKTAFLSESTTLSRVRDKRNHRAVANYDILTLINS
jgi:hypothetical protein